MNSDTSQTRNSQTRNSRTRNSDRISIPTVTAAALPWYLAVFTAITVYLTVTNTIFDVMTEKAVGWPAIQYIVTAEILKAGGVALIVSPVIVEVGRMVLAEIWTERRLRKARSEARAEVQRLWEEWNRRREAAEGQRRTLYRTTPRFRPTTTIIVRQPQPEGETK